MELTSAVRSVSSSNKCNGMITAVRQNQADALNPHPPHGESFFLSPSLSKRIYATSLQPPGISGAGRHHKTESLFTMTVILIG